MDSPEQVQIVLAPNIKIRIAGYAAANIGVIFPLNDKSGPHWILENIVHHAQEGLLYHFAFTQDMVMRLVLPFCRIQSRAEVFADELDGETLIRLVVESKEERMDVIRHQDVGWTRQTIARTRMKQYLAKRRMKVRRQPARGPVFKGQGPVHAGQAAVGFRR
jgi:hypothetical protein